MTTYPEMIERAALETAEIDRELATMRAALTGLEAVATGSVLAAVDDKGKPLYTNDAARKSAIDAACLTSEAWQKATLEIRRLLFERASAAAELERLRGEFKLHLLEREAVVVAARRAA